MTLHEIHDKYNYFLAETHLANGERTDLTSVVRNGMVMLIPVLLIGAFALTVRFFPISVYQTFIRSFAGGFIDTLFEYVSNATFGLMSVLMTFSISYCYLTQYDDGRLNVIAGVMTSLICFYILIGGFTSNFQPNLLGSQGVASAIICGIFAAHLYRIVSGIKFFSKHIFSDGSDIIFNSMIFSTLPACITIVLFALCNLIIIKMFRVNCFHDIFVGIGTWLFGGMGRSFFSGILFIFFSTALWFVGIHGSNVFHHVAEDLFQSGIAVNAAAVAAGQAPTEIVTKTFLDCFVIMGGCGSTLCLLIAILIFSRRENVRGLAKYAAVPAIFNINELVVFGLPIIFNRYFLIPFLATPIILYSLAYLATMIGFVPIISNEVFWTTPVFFSGYWATHSVAGIIMQIINIAVGVCIYAPFVRKFDRAKDEERKEHLSKLVDILKESEKSAVPITLTNMRSTSGALAKSLASELKNILAQRSFRMYYQPQFNHERQLIGAEALLRWHHPDLGMMYPPLIVKLAGESDMKVDLEKFIFETVAAETVALKERTGYRGHVSVNVTVSTLKSQGFEKFLDDLIQKYHIQSGDLCIEITEESELILDDNTIALIDRIRKMGFIFALDDFAMGHTSLKYLQTNQFDEVKLDGSIVSAMTENSNVKDIIDSILYLSRSMGFTVLAEYVETQDQCKQLEQMGCTMYQGYLFSPALPMEEFINKYNTEWK